MERVLQWLAGESLTRSSAAAAVATMALVLAAHLLLRWGVTRRWATTDTIAGTSSTVRPQDRHWLPWAVREVSPAVALLIWIQGLYVAFGLLLSAADPAAEGLRTGLGWAYRLGVLVALVWALARIGRVAEAVLVSISAQSHRSWDDFLLPFAGKAARGGLPLLAVILGAPTLSLSPALAEIVRGASSLLLIGFVAFVLYQAIDAATALVLSRHRIDVDDNLQARAIYTQVVVLKKVAVTIVVIFTLASMLMVFEPVRQFGASILASAGVAGLVVGFAAQKSIATLLAGFQIALTQPIRVDDVVIVEGEWGRIEEITLTYVVVCIWDLRRLVVPIGYFIEQPFQNWTRTSADLLGTVELHVDYTVPVDALRTKLTSILESSRHWDRKVNVLQVTDATEQTLVVRALASAANASSCWDLRCEVREKLVAYLRREHPESFPRVRGRLEAMAPSVPRTGWHEADA
jgi:small-conductance mechanosensitive channel